jgi:recombination protein RecA
MFNEGISIIGDLIDLAVEDGIIDKSGSWFSYGEVRLGQGRENSKQLLAENTEMFEEIKQKVLVARGVAEVEENAADKAETSQPEDEKAKEEST